MLEINYFDERVMRMRRAIDDILLPYPWQNFEEHNSIKLAVQETALRLVEEEQSDVQVFIDVRVDIEKLASRLPMISQNRIVVFSALAIIRCRMECMRDPVTR